MTTSRLLGSVPFNGSVSARSLGKPAAVFPGAVAGDSDLIIGVDRQQTQLAQPLSSTDTQMSVADPSQIVAYNLLSIDNEIVKTTGPPTGNIIPISRGFDGTTPAVHLASATVSGFVDAYHHNALVAEIEAIETALGANLSRIPSAGGFIFAQQYNFPAQSPGGTLNVGTNSITLTPVPKGVNGTDTNHWLYVSGGTGAAEAVLITGGSAVSGAASGTLFVTCANTHSGAWTIQSATAGIIEGKTILGAGGGVVVVQPGVVNIYATIYIDTPIWLLGQGHGSSVLTAAFAAPDVIQVNHIWVTISNLGISAAAGVTRTGNGITVVTGLVGTTISDVKTGNQNIGILARSAVYITRCYSGELGPNVVGYQFEENGNLITNSQANHNTSYGVKVNGSITGFQMQNVVTADNGISNVIAFGSVAVWQSLWCGGSHSGTGPNWDLTGATVGPFDLISPYFEFNGPAIKFGNANEICIRGGTVAVNTAQPGLLFSGTQAFHISIANVQFVGGGPCTTAIDFGTSNAAFVTISSGNVFDGWVNGINCGTSAALNGCTITGNHFNITGDPLIGTFASGGHTNAFQGNIWGSHAPTMVPTYPSATPLILKPFDSVVYVSGTVLIININDIWPTRTITLIFTAASPAGLGLGGNITRAIPAVQNQAITLVAGPDGWH